mgnify:CR=1 FL=1
MSCSKNAFCCLCKHAVKGVLHHLGIQVATCCHNYLAKLSQIMELLIICLPWGWENEEARKLPPKILHRCVTCMAWSSILLPPHGVSIDVVSMKVSLNHVIVYDTDILSHVKISLPVQCLVSSHQPKPLFAVYLGKIQCNDPVDVLRHARHIL